MEPFAFLLPVLVNLHVTLKAGYILRGIKTDHPKENGVLSSRNAACSSRLTHKLTTGPLLGRHGAFGVQVSDEI